MCGKGIEKTVGIDLHRAWTYPGTTVRIQHCQETGAQQVCTTFWKRTITR